MPLNRLSPPELSCFEWAWPRDFARLAPIPGGIRLRLTGAAPFSVRPVGAEPESLVATEDPLRTGSWNCEWAVPEVTEPRLAWFDVETVSAGRRAAVLLLPDAGATAVRLRSGVGGEAFGVMANRRGAAAQARAAWGRLESQYDCLLAANFNPNGPDDRRVLLTRLRLWLRLGGDVREADTAAVTQFEMLGPQQLRWHLSLRGVRWCVTAQLGAGNSVRVDAALLGPVADDVELFLRPELENRSFHTTTRSNDVSRAAMEQNVTVADDSVVLWAIGDGRQLSLRASGPFRHEPEWSLDVPLCFERERGLATSTDLFSPGAFCWSMGREAAFWLEVSADKEDFAAAVAGDTGGKQTWSLPEAMEQALTLFLADRDGETTVIAGYPWFLDWGRDSLIFVRGLVAAGRQTEALSILRRFAAFERGGSIPNVIRGDDASNRETSDGPLWWLLALRDLSVRDPKVLLEKVGRRTLGQVALDIVKAHVAGPEHGVRFSVSTGLLWSPSHYTWMDTANPAGSPREGYPVSLQAMWAAALEFAHSLETGGGWDRLAQKVRQESMLRFWREEDGFLADCLHGPAGAEPDDCLADDHLRSNQLLAVTLGLVADAEKIGRILQACSQLLVPGGLRSLADRPVLEPLRVEWHGTTLHDPHRPYHGRYSGPEDFCRKPAYHNGTAWTWTFPHFAEAMALHFGESGCRLARRLMAASAWPMEGGCLGQLPEIVDGDAPHTPRGCGAQAWSASEWVRVWKFLAAAQTCV